MCERVFEKHKFGLGPVPDDLKAQRIRDDAVRNNPYNLMHVPGCFMNQEMFEKAAERCP